MAESIVPISPSSSDDRLRTFYAARRVAVTGGAGFIGSHLTSALAELGAEVSVIDDLSNSSVSRIVGLIDRYPGRVSLVEGSILEPAALSEAFERCGTVFHQAAMVSVPRSMEEPERTMFVNTLGTTRVAQAARASGATRLVYAASSSAYGDSEELPKREDMPERPLSPYAVSKLAGEHVVRAWATGFGLDGVSLRYFNIFGEGQPADSPYSAVIARFAALLQAGEAVTVFGDGEQSRDFTHVTNAVRANLLAGAAPDRLNGQVVNIGCGQATTISRLVRRLADRLGVDRPQVEHAPDRAGDVRHSHADIAAAKNLLGYEPVLTFEQGLDQMLQGGIDPIDRGVIGKIG
ncbi:MAG: NAD-dependent epimerase/dehydratase family protein [Planctomycetota bacterium]